jgi:hypothetical protein
MKRLWIMIVAVAAVMAGGAATAATLTQTNMHDIFLVPFNGSFTLMPQITGGLVSNGGLVVNGPQKITVVNGGFTNQVDGGPYYVYLPGRVPFTINVPADTNTYTLVSCASNLVTYLWTNNYVAPTSLTATAGANGIVLTNPVFAFNGGTAHLYEVDTPQVQMLMWTNNPLYDMYFALSGTAIFTVWSSGSELFTAYPSTFEIVTPLLLDSGFSTSGNSVAMSDTDASFFDGGLGLQALWFQPGNSFYLAGQNGALINLYGIPNIAGFAVTATSVTNNGLTSSKLMATDGNKAEVSVSTGTGLTLSGTTLSPGGMTTNILFSFGTTNRTMNFTNGILMGIH